MIYTGDCLEILPTLDAESVQCCVTSPPYYGLRDYGCDGQIGLESTPEAYVEKLVQVFREVRRVLRDDGTVWLNLGSSYAGGQPGSGGSGATSGKQVTNRGSYFGDTSPNPLRPVQHEHPCGNDDIEPSDSIEIDPACPRSDDERQGGYQTHQNRTSRIGTEIASASLLPLPTTHDNERLGSEVTIPDALPHDVQESTTLESSPQPPALCLQTDSFSAYLSSEGLRSPAIQQNAHTGGNKNDTSLSDETSAFHKQDTELSSKAYQEPPISISPNLTTMFHNVKFKPKDLIPIPWMVAMALQADGWYLRQDIIWSKPNPMPESVTDRCTKAHEYIFLFSKGQWKSRVVKFADLSGEYVHFGKYLGANAPYSWGCQLCVRLASSIFDFAQSKENFSLPPFYAQEWKQLSDGGDSDFVRRLPADHIPAVWAARFLDGNATAEQFLKEMNRGRVALRNGNDLLKGGVSPVFFDTPSLYTDSEGTITIHDSGKISKIDVFHDHIIASVPTTCKYFYDAEAVKEPITQSSIERLSQPNLENQVGSERVPGKTNGPMKAVIKRASPNFYTGAAYSTPQSEPRGSARNFGDFDTRNRRSVWTITTKPFKEAHFATFPPEIPEICIKAGSKIGDTILDPFSGSGTTGNVAERLNRKYIGIELNPVYTEMGDKRIESARLPLFSLDNP